MLQRFNACLKLKLLLVSESQAMCFFKYRHKKTTGDVCFIVYSVMGPAYGEYSQNVLYCSKELIAGEKHGDSF